MANWLNRLSGAGGALGSLWGDNTLPQGGVMGEPQRTPQQDARLAFAAQLLQGSGGTQGNFGEIMGKALLASRQARLQTQELQANQQAQQAENALRQAQTEKAGITTLGRGEQMRGNTGNLIADNPMVFGNSNSQGPLMNAYTLHVQQAQEAGKEPLSIDDFLPYYTDRTTKMVPTVKNVAGVETVVTPRRGGGGSQAPLTDIGTVAANAGTVAGTEAAGKAETERYSRFVDIGLDAADSVSTVKRGIQLLDDVKTGGIDVVKLKATNLFGVTGADEAELSRNLGKAVLSQLRVTFGAQFTEKEGARLADIEAGFSKSTEGNRRLLEQAQKILERAARRGLSAAEHLGDADTAQQIRDSLNFSLTPGATPTPKPAGDKTIIRTGTQNGRKVILYSDGSSAYAN